MARTKSANGSPDKSAANLDFEVKRLLAADKLGFNADDRFLPGYPRTARYERDFASRCAGGKGDS